MKLLSLKQGLSDWALWAWSWPALVSPKVFAATPAQLGGSIEIQTTTGGLSFQIDKAVSETIPSLWCTVDVRESGDRLHLTEHQCDRANLLARTIAEVDSWTTAIRAMPLTETTTLRISLGFSSDNSPLQVLVWTNAEHVLEVAATGSAVALTNSPHCNEGRQGGVEGGIIGQPASKSQQTRRQPVCTVQVRLHPGGQITTEITSPCPVELAATAGARAIAQTGPWCAASPDGSPTEYNATHTFYSRADPAPAMLDDWPMNHIRLGPDLETDALVPP